MIYKIVSKVLCEYLTKVLPNLIYENLGTFLKSRNASTTTLICLEIIHQISNSPGIGSNKNNITVKHDLSKTFDRVK